MIGESHYRLGGDRLDVPAHQLPQKGLRRDEHEAARSPESLRSIGVTDVIVRVNPEYRLDLHIDTARDLTKFAAQPVRWEPIA